MDSAATDAGGYKPSPAFLVGVLLTAGLAALYPLWSDDFGHPLTIFIVPVLITVALGAFAETVVMSTVVLVLSIVYGAAVSHLGGSALTGRLIIVVAAIAAGVFVADVRRRHEEAFLEADRTAELLLVFQTALIPRPSPPDDVAVHSRYVPGEQRMQLGGDFIDALEMPDGSLAFIIGDVCGHGPEAAAFGAALRAGWKTVATTRPEDPVHWVETMETAFFSHGRHDTFVTICTGRFDTETGDVRLVCAGHPWPIVLGADTRMIEPHVSVPLGLHIPSTRRSTDFTLRAGERLMLYTDGLIENRHPATSADRWGEDALMRFVRADERWSLDDLLEQFGPEGYSDDVAVMTFGLDRIGLTAREDGANHILTPVNAVWALEMRFEPEPGTPRQARREIARVFAEHPRLEEILLCVSEVVSNAVLHARTEITLAAARSGDVVRVEVSDLSDVLPTRRQPDRMSPTGRGLHLLDMRTADWGVDLVGRGKTVWFEITSASPGGGDV